MSDSHFDNIVNECLERLAAGESVMDCLARYPEHADELAPLLGMMHATTQASRAAMPSVAGKARGMERMQAALAKGRHRRGRRLQLPRIFWRPITTPIAVAFRGGVSCHRCGRRCDSCVRGQHSRGAFVPGEEHSGGCGGADCAL